MTFIIKTGLNEFVIRDKNNAQQGLKMCTKNKLIIFVHGFNLRCYK